MPLRVVDFDAADGERQFAVKFVEFAAIETEHCVGMSSERKTQGFGRNERVAVAVAADPAADFEDIRNVDAGIAV